jgi:hypothetical protein
MDPEPETRFSAEWNDWQRRHWDRQQHAAELAEAEALSTYPEDPAPLASEGLEVFLKWEKRQDGRRAARCGFNGRRIA